MIFQIGVFISYIALIYSACLDPTWVESSTGRCFQAFDFKVVSENNSLDDQWKVADRYCWNNVVQPTRLATIYTEEESQIVSDLASPLGQCWIGLRKYRIISDKGWWWVDGDAPLSKDSFTNYDPKLNLIWLWLPPYEKCGVTTNSGWNIKNCKLYRDETTCFVCATTSKIERNPDVLPPLASDISDDTVIEDNANSTTNIVDNSVNTNTDATTTENNENTASEGNLKAEEDQTIVVETTTTTTVATTTTTTSTTTVPTTTTTTTTTTIATTTTTTSTAIYDSNDIWDSCSIFGNCNLNYNDNTDIENYNPTQNQTPEIPIVEDAITTIDSSGKTNDNDSTKNIQLDISNSTNSIGVEYIILIAIAVSLVILSLSLFVFCKKKRKNKEEKIEDIEIAKSPVRNYSNVMRVKSSNSFATPSLCCSGDQADIPASVVTSVVSSIIPPGKSGKCNGDFDDRIHL